MTADIPGHSRDTSAHVRGRQVALRAVSGIGAILAAWVAGDSILSGMTGSGSGTSFILFWGVPFAVAAVFLAWFAVRGSRAAVRATARSGCLHALALGGAVFLVLFASPLILPWDALRGAVAAFMYAPLAAAIGLAIGLVARGARHSR